MKKALTYIFILTIATFLAFPVISQTLQKHSRVKVYANHQQLHQMQQAGLAVDHGAGKHGVYHISDFSEREILMIQSLGLDYDVLIEDVTAFYASRNEFVPGETFKKSAGCVTTGTPNYPEPSNFSLGSMGGFFTYQEFLDHLDTMAAQYPDLITVRAPIDTFLSHEGRPIYWLKISDNVLVDEAEPEVLYTSIHHAREPQSLTQLIYFMYYILENYDTDDEVKYLIDHTEMYFIPMVNPDGYIYNQTTNPNGGGLWRKNRRNNGGGEFGVDLNRNYGYLFGYDDIGSSPDSSSNTYRGPGPFSEPETQAVKFFTESHSPSITLNYHSFSNVLIYPWGYEESIFTPDSAQFVALAKILTAENHYQYGTGDQTLGYVTNGDADDWGYGEQNTKEKSYAFTPEVGSQNQGFWPSIGDIIPLSQINVRANLNMSHLAGAYAEVRDQSPVLFQSLSGFIQYEVQRIGLDSTATYTVSLTAISPDITNVGAAKTYASMGALEVRNDSISIHLNANTPVGTEFSFVLSIDNGSFTWNDTITKVYGQAQTLYAADDNLTDWMGNWQTTTSDFVSAPNSVTDSPVGDYFNNSASSITLDNPVNLAGSLAAKLNFWAKWDIEADFDFVQVLASNNNSDWVPLCGNYTNSGTINQELGEPLYDGTQSEWVYEEMDLTDFLGDFVYIRFRIESDQFVTGDGFYFDDLRIDMIEDPTISIAELTKEQLISVSHLPNPSSSQAYIRFQLPPGSGNGSLVVYNAIGQPVKRQTISNNQRQVLLNTAGYANGVYYYQIVSDNGQSSTLQKLAVVH